MPEGSEGFLRRAAQYICNDVRLLATNIVTTPTLRIASRTVLAALLGSTVVPPTFLSAQDVEEIDPRPFIAEIEHRLFSARNLLCEFQIGTVADYHVGLFSLRSDPQIKLDSSLTSTRITEIDLANESALLNEEPVTIAQTGSAISVLETTPLGHWVVTTVFALRFSDSGEFAAVRSSHVSRAAAGSPNPSQYQGRCVAY